MSDLYLDLTTMDLPTVPRLTRGEELVAQRIRAAIGRQRGEHPLDPSKGLDWVTWMGSRRLPIETIRSWCMLTASRDPDVDRVLRTDVGEVDGRLELDLVVALVNGQRLQVRQRWELTDPFVARFYGVLP